MGAEGLARPILGAALYFSRPTGRARTFLSQALSLRLLYAADANETLAAFQHAAAAIEAGPHVHVAALKLARRALAGVLSAHEGKLQMPMVAWLKAADVNVRPEDLTDAH